MPTYVYEAADAGKACDKCRDGFEVVQKLGDAKLETCPVCDGSFNCLKKVSSGEYEKAF